MRKITLFFCMVLFCYTQVSIAANPTVSTLSGSTTDGQQITITGTNFGTKSPAAPILYDSFDSGSNGAYVAATTDWTPHAGNGPTYSNTSPFGGSGLCAYAFVEDGDSYPTGFESAYYTFSNQDQVYYSYMNRHVGTDPDAGVYKNGRISTSASDYDGAIMMAISDGYVFYVVPGGGDVYPAGRWFDDGIGSSTWERHQMYGRVSSPAGTANGEVYAQVNVEVKRYNNIVTRAAGYSTQYGSVLLSLMHDPDSLPNGAYHHMYVDDVYVDNTRARVELCSGSTWSDGHDCVPQPPVSWSGTEVVATVNRGSLTSGTAYIYVVNSDGEVNSSGKLFETSEADETAPTVSGLNPAASATNVSKSTNIVAHVTDTGDGVDQSTIVMTVEGTAVTPTITGTSADYTLTYNPPSDFAYSRVVNVTIDADDLAETPNSMTQYGYSFTILPNPGVTSATDMTFVGVSVKQD